MHGEEVEAEEDPAAQVSEVPVPHKVGAHHKGDGGQVEEVSQGQVDDVNIHGAAAPHGDGGDHQCVDVPRRAHHAHGAQDAAQEGGGQEVAGSIGRGVELGAAILWIAQLRGARARLHPRGPSRSWDRTSPAATPEVTALEGIPNCGTAAPGCVVPVAAPAAVVALSFNVWLSPAQPGKAILHAPAFLRPREGRGRGGGGICPSALQRVGTRRLLPLPPTGMLAQLLTGRELGKKHRFLHVRNFSLEFSPSQRMGRRKERTEHHPNPSQS